MSLIISQRKTSLVPIKVFEGVWGTLFSKSVPHINSQINFALICCKTGSLDTCYKISLTEKVEYD